MAVRVTAPRRDGREQSAREWLDEDEVDTVADPETQADSHAALLS